MEYYNFDNKYFIDSLKSAGFYIAENSKANYPGATFFVFSLNSKYEVYKLFGAEY